MEGERERLIFLSAESCGAGNTWQLQLRICFHVYIGIGTSYIGRDLRYNTLLLHKLNPSFFFFFEILSHIDRTHHQQ